jgi:AraC-like DNA-binding protein
MTLSSLEQNAPLSSRHIDPSPAMEIIELGPKCVERYFCRAGFPLLEGLGVPAAGLSDLAGHYRVERCLDRHLVEITLAGAGWGGAAEAPAVLGEGTVLLVPAGTPYVLHTRRGAPWRTAWALLDPDVWRGFPPAAVLQALFDEVEARPAADWGVERLSARLGCSRSHLHRLCVEAFGCGPAAQVNRVRMLQAEYWLTTTALPPKVIADRLGFANPYHFSAAFKRHSGHSPAVFRGRLSRSSAAARPTASPPRAARRNRWPSARTAAGRR